MLYDGIKSAPVPLSEWSLGGDPQTTTLTVHDAYAQVPWLYRAVDLRAKAVAKVPLALYKGNGKTDVSTRDQYAPIVTLLRTLFYQSEASLCLYARNYWIIERNAAGLNPTPRWLLPTTIEPQYSVQAGLTGWKRHINGKHTTIPLDQLIYHWMPSFTSELGPGIAPAQVALKAAGVLHSLDVFVAGFFERGAIRATLLQIDGKAHQAEKDKLEAWWKRMLGGAKKAYETVAISAAVKPIVIGDGLKETINKSLTDQERENVATALGVPHSLLFSNASTFATAQQDWLNLYDQTVIPECQLLEGPINERWLKPLGLRLEFLPNKLEVYQASELTKAEAIMKLVGRPVLSVDEGREMLGYAPDESAQPAVADPATDPTADPTTDPTATTDDAPDPNEQKAIDRERWQRKALKRLQAGKSPAVSFDSDWLNDDEAARISQALATATTAAEVKAAFTQGIS